MTALICLMHGCTNFPRIWKPLKNARHCTDGIKQVACLGSTNIRCNHTKLKSSQQPDAWDLGTSGLMLSFQTMISKKMYCKHEHAL